MLEIEALNARQEHLDTAETWRIRKVLLGGRTVVAVRERDSVERRIDVAHWLSSSWKPADA